MVGVVERRYKGQRGVQRGWDCRGGGGFQRTAVDVADKEEVDDTGFVDEETGHYDPQRKGELQQSI